MNPYFIEIDDRQQFDLGELARPVYKLACRTDFSQPGFALIKLPADETSAGLRRAMVNLKEMLSHEHREKRGVHLEWFNMTRFDQKNTTKPHRDGAPRESLLILGYEPTIVKSIISMADYSRCAHEMGITPDKFLEDFNPMYEKGLEKLAPYTTQILEFDPSSFQMLIVNNSSNALSSTEARWQGVLHSATVSNDAASRIINSTCIAPSDSIDSVMVEPAQLAAFLESDAVAGAYA
jgi:hypothetical protein